MKQLKFNLIFNTSESLENILVDYITNNLLVGLQNVWDALLYI